MSDTSITEVEGLQAEVARFVADYRHMFPEPYSLPPNLQLAVRAIAEADNLRAKVEAVTALVERTEKAAEDSLSRTFGGAPFPGFVMIADLRDILR
jgi:hypothetical protein